MLSRDLLRLKDKLDRERPDVDLFCGDESDQKLSMFLPAVELVARAARVARKPALVVKLVLQALELQKAAYLRRYVVASFVATMPGEVPIGVAATAQAVADMLRGEAQEVLALGYEISDERVVARLKELAHAGARVTLITHDGQTDISALIAGWPMHCRPRVFVASPDAPSGPYGKMHSKALVVDEDDLLVTSANLTFHGLSGNIEFGVRIRGAAASDAKAVFEHMLRSGALVQWAP